MAHEKYIKKIDIKSITPFSLNTFRKFIREKQFRALGHKGEQLLITCERSSQKNKEVLYCIKKLYHKILSTIYREDLIRSISSHRKNIEKSVSFMMLLLIIFSIALLYWCQTLIVSTFIIHLIAKIGITIYGIFAPKKYTSDTKYHRLPTYTILLPLYREDATMEQLMNSIYNIHYPKHLLTIMIIIEEDDEHTINGLNKLNLHDNVEIIKVPRTTLQPQTKARALNYAMYFVTSEMIVIYDAEDIVDKEQLMIISSHNAEGKYDALQARLNQYNYRSSFVATFSTLQYMQWFDYLLPSLSRLNITIPLGGTSNHINVKALEKVQFWDSRNVAEDMELTYQFLLDKQSTVIVDTTKTIEESVVTVHTYIKQRSRWVKGHIHMFISQCLNIRDEITKKNYINTALWGLYFGYFVILSNFSVLVIFLTSAYRYYLYSEYDYKLAIITMHTLWAIIFDSYLCYKRLQYNGLKSIFVAILARLFLCQIIISCVAIFEILVGNISFWHKTTHGIDKYHK